VKLAFEPGENPHRPAPGSSTKVDPIRDIKAIKRIKRILADKPRDLCLFTLGINTAYRANELLSLQVSQVDHLSAGDVLEVKQSKTNKYRSTPLNASVIQAIDHWLLHHPSRHDDAPLFIGQRGNRLTVPTANNLVKGWCRDVGLNGNFGSHTLRKTWGYHQRVQKNAPIPLLMEAFRHQTQRQTLDYLGIQAEEIADLYSLEL